MSCLFPPTDGVTAYSFSKTSCSSVLQWCTRMCPNAAVGGGGSLAMRLGRPKLVGLRYTMRPWRIPNHVAIGAHTPERHTQDQACHAVAAFACLHILPFPRTRAFAAATFLVVRSVQPKLGGLRYTMLPWRIPNHMAIGAHTPERQARLDVGRAQFEFACLVVVV